MTIHYATGVGADAHAVLDGLRTFLTTDLGWSEDLWSSAAGISRLHVHDGARHFSFDCRSRTWDGDTSLAFGLCACTGHDAGANWDAQPGTSLPQYANRVGAASLSWHAYAASGADGSYCHLVVDANHAGRVATLHFGMLDPVWVTDGGQFAEALNVRPNNGSVVSHWPYRSTYTSGQFSPSLSHGAVRAEIDGAVAPTWRTFQYASGYVSQQFGFLGDLTQRLNSPTALSGATILWPIVVHAKRTSGHWSPYGQVPGQRECVLALVLPGEEITLGSEVWQVWPVIRRGAVRANGESTNMDTSHSGWLGFAYRKS